MAIMTISYHEFEDFLGYPLPSAWQDFFRAEIRQAYFVQLFSLLKKAYRSTLCYPPKALLFHAFELTTPQNLKGLILGQDPYINENQATGLAFSVPMGQKCPPSLKTVSKELKLEFGYELSQTGNLEHWAQQGVFLLNSILSVEARKSGSHQNFGWQIFTDNFISYLNNHFSTIFYLLWGSFAHQKQQLITNPNALVLKAAHPSPLARDAFLGCNCFKEANAFLLQNNLTPIAWQIA